jgi:ubiquinone/menaquinone biosynthesis C-methylase UbiE
MADEWQSMTWSDGEAYEKFMGQWSRVAGRVFLDWLSLPNGLKWLDVGCGTGAFTETIQELSSVGELVAIDISEAQLAYARSRNHSDAVTFQVIDARSLPFDNDRFDVAVSALVCNFIPDREKALSEMNRVVRPNGTLGAYVWDFAGKSGINQHLNLAIAELQGADYKPKERNDESTTQDSLRKLFSDAGLGDVLTRAIEIPVRFNDLDDYWNSNTTRFGAQLGAFVHGLSEAERQRLRSLVLQKLPVAPDGRIAYTARVNAVKGRRI